MHHHTSVFFLIPSRLALYKSRYAMDALASLLGTAAAKHPYSPASLALPGYAPVARSLPSVLIPFFGVAGAVTAGAWAWAGAYFFFNSTRHAGSLSCDLGSGCEAWGWREGGRRLEKGTQKRATHRHT